MFLLISKRKQKVRQETFSSNIIFLSFLFFVFLSCLFVLPSHCLFVFLSFCLFVFLCSFVFLLLLYLFLFLLFVLSQCAVNWVFSAIWRFHFVQNFAKLQKMQKWNKNFFKIFKFPRAIWNKNISIFPFCSQSKK